jgi:replicative DNA helicase
VKLDQVGEYEHRYVGAALLHPELVDASGLAPKDFGTAWCRQAWEGITQLAHHSEPVNELTVSEVSGLKASDLTAATDNAILPSAAQWFAMQIRAAADRRRLRATCKDVIADLDASNGADPVPSAIAKLAAAIDHTPASEQPRPLPEFIDELVADLPARREKGRPGLSSGFPTMDSLTGGLRAAMLIVIAAATGIGKSLFAANVALAADVATLVFSLEMAGLEVTERIIAAASGVEAKRIQRGNVSDGEIAVLRRQAEAHRRIWIDERPAPGVAEIAATARSLHRREKIGLVIVDYLQIVRTEQDERREAEVAAVARGLRALARQLNVPVIALAQLNRDGMVRDSAVIEHECHVLGVLERKKGSEQATLEIRKNRHGPEGCIALRFDPKTLRLREEERG